MMMSMCVTGRTLSGRSPRVWIRCVIPLWWKIHRLIILILPHRCVGWVPKWVWLRPTSCRVKLTVNGENQYRKILLWWHVVMSCGKRWDWKTAANQAGSKSKQTVTQTGRRASVVMIESTLLLFMVIDPFGNLPFVLAVLEGSEKSRYFKIILRET